MIIKLYNYYGNIRESKLLMVSNGYRALKIYEYNQKWNLIEEDENYWFYKSYFEGSRLFREVPISENEVNEILAELLTDLI